MLTSCTRTHLLCRRAKKYIDARITYNIADIKHDNDGVNIQNKINIESSLFDQNNITIIQFIDISIIEESKDYFIDLAGQVHMGNGNLVMSSFLLVEKNDPGFLKINHYTIIYYPRSVPTKFIGGTLYENDKQYLDFLQEFLINSYYYSVEYFIYQKNTNEISGPYSVSSN